MNLSKTGVGWSFGLLGVRLGIRPDGRRYVTTGFLGLFRYLKVFKR